MSSTILNGDFTVYYSTDNNRKQIAWSGTTNTYTVNQLYSALQELFDEPAQLVSPVAMSAQTPTAYTIGCIDPSDTIPWFIDDATTQHLQGGAISTSKWTRIAGTQAGIMQLLCTTGTVVYGDIGNTITSSDGSSGVLLDVQISGAATTLYVRPADSTSANNFATVGATLTCNSHTAVTTGAYSSECLWSNIYSLGTLAVDTGNNQVTDLYVYQNGSKIVGWASGAPASYPWWSTGQIDILVKVKSPSGTLITGSTHTTTTVDSISPNTIGLVVGQSISGAGILPATTITAINSISSITISQAATATASGVALTSNVIDAGYVTVYPREYNETYGYFSVQLLSGGRNPIPLATGSDLNNPTGLRQLTVSAGTGSFGTGETMYVGTTLAAYTKKGLVTAVSGVAGAQTVTYSLLGKMTDFAASDALKGAVSGATGTAGAPVNNPATGNPATLATAPVVSYAVAGYENDISNGNGAKPYSIQLDCKSNSLSAVYEWTKYLTRRGNTTTTNTLGITGEQYIGIDNRLTYNTLTPGTFAAGTRIYQQATGASGVVVTCDTTDKIIVLRNSRGSFGMGVVTDGTNSTDSGTNVSAVTPVQTDPFGTFAGGKFFFAAGIYPINYLVADTQNYQLTANDGSVQIPPDLVTVSITGLLVGDSTGVYRTSSGTINKSAYAIGGSLVAAATSVVSATALNADEPQAGFVRVVKQDGGGISEEHRYRYASWTGSTFTLATTAANTVSSSAVDSGNALTITLGSAIDTTVQVGDMVLNTTTNDYGYVIGIASTTSITVRTKSGSTANWAAGNAVKFNVLVTTYTNAEGDTLYVPIIDSYITTGTSASNTLIYGANLNFSVLVRVRHYDSITPFEQSTTVGSTGLTVAAIRTADTICTPVAV